MSSLFIVIDGPDGSGSTHHTSALAKKLESEGHDVLQTMEPTESAFGKQIRAFLNGDELPDAAAMQLLFTADRAEHVGKEIQPALDAGTSIVCDRYTISTEIYGAEQGVDRDWLKQINDHFPKPDLTFITLPSFETCMDRIGSRSTQDNFEGESLQRKIYDAYAALDPQEVHFIDTSKSMEEAADAIWNIVNGMIN